MTIPFLIGLLSAVHCFGMCGGVVSALTMSLSPEIRLSNTRLFFYSLAYNLGRLLSYATAGLLVGWLGQTLINELAPTSGLPVLRTFSALIIILLGLYLGGWFPKLAMIERLGMPIWKRLQPIGQRFIPVSNPLQAFIFGAIWGWLPCGLVYYALMLSVSAGGALQSATFMLMFGLGTLLPMLAASMMAGKINSLRNNVLLRRISGGLLILMGITTLLLLFSPEILHSLHFMPQTPGTSGMDGHQHE